MKDALDEALDALESAGFHWAVACVSQEVNEDGGRNVLHLVGYPEEPTDLDLELLEEELSTDPELGMVGLKRKDDYAMAVKRIKKLN